MLDKIKEDLKKAITEFTIEDFNIYTMNELYMQVANKTNEVIEIVKLLQDYLDEQIFKDVENIELKQKVLENVFNQLIINAGNSNAEIVDARVEADGTTHSKLGNRLNSIDSQIKDIKTVELANSITVLCTGGDDTEILQNAINNYSVISLQQGAVFNLTSSIDTKGKTIICNNATLCFKQCDGLIVSGYTKTVGRLYITGDGYYEEEYMSCVSNRKKASYSEYKGVIIGSSVSEQAIANHSSIDEIIVRGFKTGVDIQRIWGLSINKIETMHNEVGLNMKGISSSVPLADIDIKYIMCYSNGINIVINYYEFGTFGTIQCMEHRNIDSGEKSGVRLSNCKAITINNLWLEFYNVPSDLSGVNTPSDGIDPNNIRQAIKYPLLISSSSYINILNIYCHKARLMCYLYFTGSCVFSNVYHTSASGKLTLGGTQHNGTFVNYSWGNEGYKNIFINSNEPIIARNSGNTQYQGGFVSVKNNSIVIEGKGRRMELLSDNITRKIYDINGISTTNTENLFS